MNKTQKNWKKAFKEYEETEYDRIYREPRKRVFRKKERPVIVTIILMILATMFVTYLQNESDKWIQRSAGNQSQTIDTESNWLESQIEDIKAKFFEQEDNGIEEQ